MNRPRSATLVSGVLLLLLLRGACYLLFVGALGLSLTMARRSEDA